MQPTIGALYVYPVKSCKGIALQQAVLTTQGLLWDREWVVRTGRTSDGHVAAPRYVAGFAAVPATEARARQLDEMPCVFCHMWCYRM